MQGLPRSLLKHWLYPRSGITDASRSSILSVLMGATGCGTEGPSEGTSVIWSACDMRVGRLPATSPMLSCSSGFPVMPSFEFSSSLCSDSSVRVLLAMISGCKTASIVPCACNVRKKACEEVTSVGRFRISLMVSSMVGFSSREKGSASINVGAGVVSFSIGTILNESGGCSSVRMVVSAVPSVHDLQSTQLSMWDETHLRK